jgi:hypothetical protein
LVTVDRDLNVLLLETQNLRAHLVLGVIFRDIDRELAYRRGVPGIGAKKKPLKKSFMSWVKGLLRTRRRSGFKRARSDMTFSLSEAG